MGLDAKKPAGQDKKKKTQKVDNTTVTRGKKKTPVQSGNIFIFSYQTKISSTFQNSLIESQLYIILFMYILSHPHFFSMEGIIYLL